MSSKVSQDTRDGLEEIGASKPDLTEAESDSESSSQVWIALITQTAKTELTDMQGSNSSSPYGGDESFGDDSLDPLRRAARIIKSGKAKNVVFLLGAGISTSAGIPDFRSPETGLYHNLQALNLPFPEAVFELGFFQKRPEPFWALAKEIYPGRHFPTPTHYLLELFRRHNVLKRVFTQNIDTLESIAGLPADMIVEAHGSFATAHCLKCRRQVDREEVLRAGVRRGEVVKCDATVKDARGKGKGKGKDKTCGGLVKPDIVFFGEGLPDRFFELIPELRKCDLLVVIGTSLQVQPFASLVNYVPSNCPRLLINREPVGPFTSYKSELSSSRDLFYEGNADDGSRRLTEQLGWDEELEELVRDGRKRLEKQWKKEEGGQVAGQGTKEAEKKSKNAAKAVEEEETEDLEEAVRTRLKL
ncbi:hypothetical protein IAR50_005282 [Cryptococcus sp. DSM 104548]